MYDSHIHMYYGPSDSVEEFLQKTAAAGVDGGSIISPFPAGHGVTANCDQRWENRLEMVLSFTSQAPGFRSLFWLDPLEKNFEEQITMKDMIELGLTGCETSSVLREKISKKYHTGYSNAKTLLKHLNMLGVTLNELKETILNDCK